MGVGAGRGGRAGVLVGCDATAGVAVAPDVAPAGRDIPLNAKITSNNVNSTTLIFVILPVAGTPNAGPPAAIGVAINDNRAQSFIKRLFAAIVWSKPSPITAHLLLTLRAAVAIEAENQEREQQLIDASSKHWTNMIVGMQIEQG